MQGNRNYFFFGEGDTIENSGLGRTLGTIIVLKHMSLKLRLMDWVRISIHVALRR